MKRNFARVMFATILCFVIMAIAVNADFAKTNPYSDGMFTDVKTADWYSVWVKDAYEFGLMKGMGDGKFSPDGTLTVAEGLTIASRVHQTLNGTTIPTSAGEWYQTYVDYAKNSGFMRDGQFDSYTREIKRFEMASLLADVCKDLPAINTINRVPDVSVTEPYEQKVLSLYRSGILTGNDDYGTFMPFSNLKRSEISAMAVRIADSAKREPKTFKTVPARTFTDAYMMAYVGNGDGRYGIANAWKYDNRFDIYNRTGADYHYFTDESTEEYMSISRKVNEEKEGIVTASLGFDMRHVPGEDKGVHAAFISPDGKVLVKFAPVGGKLAMIGNETIVSSLAISDMSKDTKVLVDVDIDLDKNTATAIINNELIGTVTIPDLTFGNIELASTKEGKGAITFEFIKMYKNYVLCEEFVGVKEFSVGGVLPGWTVNGFALEQVISSSHGWADYDHYDTFSAKTTAKAGTVSTASKTFDATTGKVYFSTYVWLPEKADGAVVSLKSAGVDAIKFETKNGKFLCNGVELYDYVDNAWYQLSVDADTNTGEAIVRVNSKVKATVKFAAKYFDSVDVKFAPAKDAVMYFDDVILYPLVEHYDYPSQPVVAESKDYNIGVNICNLWLDSSSAEGWDVISPFPELDMYLGYYDEGLRETADWETKWMAEHGIDFMHLCWYSPVARPENPIKRGMRAEDLEDGYMNSKYSDYVDFCIMWENGSGGATDFENFKEYLWKYWVENYFKDERYVRLDGKAVLSIWDKAAFESTFGGLDGCKRVVDFMEEELVKLGYDGLILLFPTGTNNPKSFFEELSYYGVDATYAYSWGTSGWDPLYQVKGMLNYSQTASGLLHITPTVSVGFNSIPRHDERYPFITAEDHLAVCEYIRDYYLGSAKKTGTWKDNTVIVSTWNEYSEGTHVFPNNTTKWALLDNVKNTFTDVKGDHSDVDIMPTEAQKARVNRSYPQNYAPIRRHKLVEKEEVNLADYIVKHSYEMSDAGKASAWQGLHGVSSVTVEKGIMKVVAPYNDHAIKSNDNFVPMDADDAYIFHVRMKSEVPSRAEVFFTTNSEPNWSSDKYVDFETPSSGEFVDYYIDLSEHAKYAGTITAIRFDPSNTVGTTEISLIEFLGKEAIPEDKIPAILVNGYEMSFDPEFEILPDGDYRVTGEARYLGFYTNMRLKYNWDRFTGDGVLTLTTYDETEVVLTVGSDKAIVNGVEMPLGYTFSLYDGLPVFEMKKLCAVLGYKVTMNGVKMEVQAATDALYKKLYEMNTSNAKGKWPFSVDGNNENWQFMGIGSWEVSDGTLKVTPSSKDPILLVNYEFETKDYNTVFARVKYNDAMKAEGDVDRPQIFFITKASPSWTASKCINGTYLMDTLDKDGFIDVEFTLSDCAEFTGIVTAIRFDAYQKDVPYELDEIKLAYKKVDPLEVKQAYNDTGYILDESVSFEFKSASEASEWTPLGSCDVSYSKDFVKLVPIPRSTDGKCDPQYMRPLSLNASEYVRLVIGVKYNGKAMETNKPEIFFTTEADPNWTAQKCIIGSYAIPVNAEEGDVIRAVFDLKAASAFAGALKEIRFDPYNYNEAVEIDYIRFYKEDIDEEAVAAENERLLNNEDYILDESAGFDFSNPEHQTGWTIDSGELSFKDGFMVINANAQRNDPFVIHNHSIEAGQYARAEITVKYNSKVMRYNPPQIFFTTESDPNFTGPKCFTGTYVIPVKAKDGDLIKAVFDLSTNSYFNGTLKQIRFDPFQAFGVCEVSKIEFYKKRPRELTEAEKAMLSDEGYTLDETVGFEFDGINDGWIVQNCKTTFHNGFMIGTFSGPNPDPHVIHALKLNCDEYRRVVIGIKYNSALMSQFKPELFFTTEASTALSGDKRIVGEYAIPHNVREGDVIRAVFDLKSNDKFTGTLKQIRFDPWQHGTNFEIDYIRFYK